MKSFCILALFSLLSAEACPAGWVGTEEGDCYLVSRGPMNWYSAQEVSNFSNISRFSSNTYIKATINDESLIFNVLLFSPPIIKGRVHLIR